MSSLRAFLPVVAYRVSRLSDTEEFRLDTDMDMSRDSSLATPATHPAPEVGSIVHWEHVNLRVTDHRLATLYFIEGLGLTRDPLRNVSTRNMWVNVGTQQFHLPIGDPSPLPGEVGLVVPDLEAVERQLEEVTPALKETAFVVERTERGLRTRSPWGHQIHVQAQSAETGRLPQALTYVEFWVPPGTAGTIGAFYQDVLQCPVERRPIHGDPAVWVTVGSYQTFRFRERPDATVVLHTNHVAVYVTRYRAIYASLERLGALMESDANQQFRFKRIVDPTDRTLLFEFEHEVRSLHHPDYRRPLVNRIPVPYRVD
jgi:hypothetical protein